MLTLSAVCRVQAGANRCPHTVLGRNAAPSCSPCLLCPGTWGVSQSYLKLLHSFCFFSPFPFFLLPLFFPQAHQLSTHTV